MGHEPLTAKKHYRLSQNPEKENGKNDASSVVDAYQDTDKNDSVCPGERDITEQSEPSAKRQKVGVPIKKPTFCIGCKTENGCVCVDTDDEEENDSDDSEED